MQTGELNQPQRPGRRLFLKTSVLGALAAAANPCLRLSPAQAAPEGETLYNGIRLPPTWPPRAETIALEPMAVPYLASPPTVIPIDVGRQLFVDDFLIERTTLRRTYHVAQYYAHNPVLKPDQRWETEQREPMAMVFSDGVWYDPENRLFKMWYLAGGGPGRSTCYATSRDGLHWDKPNLDVRAGTNIVLPGSRDSVTVWPDREEKDPKRRYKLFRSHGDGGWALSLHFSPDGIHWSDTITRSGPVGDRTTVFYNPFRKVWVYGIRSGLGPYARIRRYWETPDVLAVHWKKDEPVLWVNADRLDPRRADLDTQPQLYNLDCVAYESILLGLFSIWRGQPKDRAKPNEVCVGFSRDGFHWHRPDRRALIPVSEQQGDWNWGNVQSAGGCCLILGDKLYFYVSGRAGVKGTPASGVSSTGLAVLRRDGFVSLDAGDAEGTLTTRPVRFSGTHLHVNADAAAGELRVEILDGEGRVLAPFSASNCEPVRTDSTLKQVSWKGGRDLAALAGKSLKFRFHLRNGRLYAFWVSPDSSGASHGYVAAGGPGLTGVRDTVGSVGYVR